MDRLIADLAGIETVKTLREGAKARQRMLKNNVAERNVLVRNFLREALVGIVFSLLF